MSIVGSIEVFRNEVLNFWYMINYRPLSQQPIASNQDSIISAYLLVFLNNFLKIIQDY